MLCILHGWSTKQQPDLSTISYALCLIYFFWGNQIFYLESPDVIEYLLTEPSFLKEIHIV